MVRVAFFERAHLARPVSMAGNKALVPIVGSLRDLILVGFLFHVRFLGMNMQMAEHKKLLDQRKRGAPGSKEAEVFHLQEAMEERNERNVRRKKQKGATRGA